jgi:hypothetical protein
MSRAEFFCDLGGSGPDKRCGRLRYDGWEILMKVVSRFSRLMSDLNEGWRRTKVQTRYVRRYFILYVVNWVCGGFGLAVGKKESNRCTEKVYSSWL